jgi:hypothetical protein
MRLENNTVFVLGAGFTKAFVPDAPLLIDDYGGPRLLRELKALPAASKILQNELRLSSRGFIDLERIMTRLYSRLPYDAESEVSNEFGLLLARLTEAFQERLRAAKNQVVHAEDLKTLASVCGRRSISCITFNYDDILDEALYQVKRSVSPTSVSLSPHAWNIDRGYGFFCRSSVTILGADPHIDVFPSALLLLKLHGSVNWRVALGSRSPYQTENLVHHERWSRSSVHPYPSLQDVEIHLEPSPIVVPPVLAKDRLLMEPFVRVVWARAKELLSDAQMVVFVGYSLPLADIASRYLFSESISPDARVEVVNYARNPKGEEAMAIRARYRQVIPGLRYDQFHFDGALEWARQLAQKYGEDAREMLIPNLEVEGRLLEH